MVTHIFAHGYTLNILNIIKTLKIFQVNNGSWSYGLHMISKRWWGGKWATLFVLSVHSSWQ